MISRRTFAFQLVKFFSVGLLLPVAESLNSCTYKNKEELLPSGKEPDLFPVNKTIHLRSPVGSETLVIGQSYIITWEAENVTKFTIQLFFGDGLYNVIAMDVTGSFFQWTVGPANTTQARIRILDASNNAVVAWTGYFTIVTEFEIDLSVYPELSSIGGSKVFNTISLNKFIVKKISATEFQTLSMICTHSGCLVNTGGPGFECPCHGSVFDDTGNVINGPALLPLNSYRTEYFSALSKVVVYSY